MNKIHFGPVVPDCYYRVSVKALITNEDGKLLFVKERNDKWDLPGGGLDHGETPHDGLKREVIEELGVAVKSISETPHEVISFVIKEQKQFVFWVLYEVVLENNKFIFSQDVQTIEFLSTKDITNISHKEDLTIGWECSNDFWQELVNYLKTKN